MAPRRKKAAAVDVAQEASDIDAALAPPGKNIKGVEDVDEGVNKKLILSFLGVKPTTTTTTSTPTTSESGVDNARGNDNAIVLEDSDSADHADALPREAASADAQHGSGASSSVNVDAINPDLLKALQEGDIDSNAHRLSELDMTGVAMDAIESTMRNVYETSETKTRGPDREGEAAAARARLRCMCAGGQGRCSHRCVPALCCSSPQRHACGRRLSLDFE